MIDFFTDLHKTRSRVITAGGNFQSWYNGETHFWIHVRYIGRIRTSNLYELSLADTPSWKNVMTFDDFEQLGGLRRCLGRLRSSDDLGCLCRIPRRCGGSALRESRARRETTQQDQRARPNARCQHRQSEREERGACGAQPGSSHDGPLGCLVGEWTVSSRKPAVFPGWNGP